MVAARTILVLLIASASAVAARADAVADFYKGKEITIQIGFGPGGGYDTTTRLFAQHFPRHMPGQPAVIDRKSVV